MSRLSSLDAGYQAGDLSVYPDTKDTWDTLYRVANNAETVLKQSLTYSGKFIVVSDTSPFPDTGLIRIGPPSGQSGTSEIVYYGKKTANTFQDLTRGYAGSRQSQWPAGAVVGAGVMAEIHNSVKDAIIQIETNLGLKDLPTDTSLNGILKAQEVRFLTPKPFFRAFPTIGPSPMRVRFQNFSGGQAIRTLWDFGDGTQSIEENPIHTYQAEGIYTVKLNIITSTGGQGIAVKNNYVTVSDDQKLPFFYGTPLIGYSAQTAAARTAAGNPTSPTTFQLVDQTDGDVVSRHWVFDDGSSDSVTDPNVHTTTHQYQVPGEYEPSLLVVFSSQSDKRIFITDKVTAL